MQTFKNSSRALIVDRTCCDYFVKSESTEPEMQQPGRSFSPIAVIPKRSTQPVTDCSLPIYEAADKNTTTAHQCTFLSEADCQIKSHSWYLRLRPYGFPQ